MSTTRADSRISVEKQPSEEKLRSLGVRDWPVWTKEVSSFDWHYDSKETCFFLEGNVIVKTDRGETHMGAGDLVIFPEGLSCVWKVLSPVKKHYYFE